jgi:hypothetical protein
MNAEEIAYAVAADLAGDLGPGIEHQTKDVWKKRPEPPWSRKSGVLAEALTRTAEIAVIAHFVVHIAPMVMDALGRRLGKDAIRKELDENAARPDGLTPEMRTKVIDAALDKGTKGQ